MELFVCEPSLCAARSFPVPAGEQSAYGTDLCMIPLPCVVSFTFYASEAR